MVEQCAAVAGGEKIEIGGKENYGPFMKFFRGGKRARRGLPDPINPAEIDVAKIQHSGNRFSRMGRNTYPAINAAISALSGHEGKKAVTVVTFGGGNPGKSIEVMQRALEKKTEYRGCNGFFLQ